ncbi:AMP-binding protein [Siccirubricoccus sp. KC 17139]|uniref:AMP-binding protein n=1 Tax=Siccirubricoccus soli TaxID=2899147 RepID=A0ABT1D9S9_9PROT|nr:AMP-binding protein [Siccirubricoccus soli]MCO6418000.1 AMP-binding protein [Siccirubricoccus soli]MCP2684135.1 AMP-binding protein [Siccirubricoccus soli]
MPVEGPDLVLTTRDAAEIICHRAGGPVTIGQFLAEAAALAATLPEQGHAVNLCADRYAALLGFAAALLRGHPTLLGARSGSLDGFLEMAAAQYPGAYVMAGAEDERRPALPFIQVDAPRPGVPLPPLRPIPAERVVAIGFTSGSTGTPTAHAKPWGALVAAAAAAAARFGLRPQDGPPASIVATVPPQHMYGFETTMMLPLREAVAIHAGASFFPAEVHDALAAVPPRRLLVTTPLHLRVLLAEGRRPPPLAAVISATAPLAQEIALAVERDWGAPMLEIYGATEAGSVASRRTVREDGWLPYDGTRVRDGAAEVPGLGTVPLADAIEPLPDGRFRLLGRLADMVKLGGKRGSLADLNRVLAEVPGVEDGVFVVPEDIESNPAARLSAVVAAPGRTPAEILDGLRGRIDPVFLPRRLAVVAALPRDPLGKLPRQALATLLAPGEEA